ncbi:MAG TPA: HEAT repeat domain-containing protein [Desulfuromonadaceae bacterium]
MDYYRPPAQQAVLDAFGSLYRALRAWRFYPKGHPSRKSSIKLANAALLALLDGNNLSLACGRSAFGYPDGEVIKDPSGMTSSLSRELLIRRVQKITLLSDLQQEDLLDFVRILTMTPEAIHQAGGLDKIMVEHGIRTIWVNEFDLSVIRGRRQQVEARGVTPPGLNEIEADAAPDAPQPKPQHKEPDPQEELQALLSRLAKSMDKESYLMAVRQSVACADKLKSRQEFSLLLPLVKLLADHAYDDTRAAELADSARFGLEQVAHGDDFLTFLLDRMQEPDAITRAMIIRILLLAGPDAINLTVEKMGATESLAERKSLSGLLVNLGESAVPPLLAMLDDNRWYIVRNLTAILGENGSPSAVPGLQKCLQHPDTRVSKEAIRSLAKIGGREAETALISIVRTGDPSLLPQALTSLGGMKSRKSLVELMHIINSDDMFLKTLSLKINALSAISMIGERQVVPPLVELLEKRHLLVRSRWEQLHVAIANCLGKLGDPRALPVLQKITTSSGALGRACAEAIESIEQAGGSDGGA